MCSKQVLSILKLGVSINLHVLLPKRRSGTEGMRTQAPQSKKLKHLYKHRVYGGLLGSLDLLFLPEIEPGPHWPEANALTTTL